MPVQSGFFARAEWFCGAKYTKVTDFLNSNNEQLAYALAWLISRDLFRRKFLLAKLCLCV